VSFVRLGSDGSDVYIFEHVDGYVVCCFCALTKKIRDRTDEELAAIWLPVQGIDRENWRAVYEPDFQTRDLDAMLAHVAEHRAAGHVVPDWVDQRLRDEWDERTAAPREGS
jgi:hypothetical protein